MRVVQASEVVDTPCWVWDYAGNSSGYGHVSVDYRTVLTHRLMYAARVGPIGEDLEVDHVCQVRRCCNPAHLEPVSHEENMLRSRQETCGKGHPLDESNATWQRGGRGGAFRIRQCRACHRLRERERYHRAKAS